MEELECTPQDLHHVRTIAFFDVTADLPELPAVGPVFATGGAGFVERFNERVAREAAEVQQKIAIPVRMHAIRLNRVADISTRYFQRAEDLKLAATKQYLASGKLPE